MGRRPCHRAAPPLITTKTGGGGDGVRLRSTLPACRGFRSQTDKIRKYSYVMIVYKSIVRICVLFYIVHILLYCICTRMYKRGRGRGSGTERVFLDAGRERGCLEEIIRRAMPSRRHREWRKD